MVFGHHIPYCRGHDFFPTVGGDHFFVIQNEKGCQALEHVLFSAVHNHALAGEVCHLHLLRQARFGVDFFFIEIFCRIVGMGQQIDAVHFDKVKFLGELRGGVPHQTVNRVSRKVLLCHAESDFDLVSFSAEVSQKVLCAL